jgi:hypothetical protein
MSHIVYCQKGNPMCGCHSGDSGCYFSKNRLPHGLTGNRERTWADKVSGVFWPEVFLKQDILNRDFGYDADVVHFWSMASQNRIGNHAQNLVNVLAQLRDRMDTVCCPPTSTLGV